eukprot:Ihof_evm2s47 gene=Ihof_evmTU2s47
MTDSPVSLEVDEDYVSDDVSEDDDGFKDAEDNRVMSDEEAIREVMGAIDLVLKNKFTEATQLLKLCVNDSMYHALGYATILWLQAMMTFEPDNIHEAIEALKHSAAVSQKRRKKVGMVKSVISGAQLTSMDNPELQAEICHSESLLLKSMCSFIADESMVAFIKGGLKIRQSFLSYKDCSNFITKIQNGGKRKYNGNDSKKEKNGLFSPMSNLSLSSKDSGSSNAKNVLNDDFVSGVSLGYGAFNLLLSLLPPRALQLLEFMGFTGDREAGLEMLKEAGLSNTLRSPLCNLVLMAYHFFIIYFMGLAQKPDMTLANDILDQALIKYPEGAIYAFYSGRRHLINGRLEDAIVEYKRSIAAQSEWVQMHHICYWELMHLYSFQGRWKDAAKQAHVLVLESKWSKATYQYMEAAYTYMDIMDTENVVTSEDRSLLKDLFASVAPYKQKIAGKSIPMEKFVIRKCRKFEMQDNYLMLPGLEMMYTWSVFQYMHSENLEAMLSLILDAITEIHTAFEKTSQVSGSSTDKKKKRESKHKEMNGMRHENIIDDLCLAYLLKGHVETLLGRLESAEKSLNEVMSNERGLCLDHWIAPFARVELALLYRQTNRNKEANEFLLAAKNNYKGYSLENRLHFRIH